MDLVDRLHQLLLSARDSAPPPSGTPSSLTIGDLYQRLIPYRSVRGELGVVELAEYEHALLRLLGGERGYLRVEDSTVREEIERELVSVHPIVGIYRDYPRAVVHLTAAQAPANPSAGGKTATQRGAVSPPEDPAPADAAAERSGPTLPEKDGAAGDLSAQPGTCRSCDRTLPPISDLGFCPYCGAARRPKECTSCASVLEDDWDFCPRCGTPRSG